MAPGVPYTLRQEVARLMQPVATAIREDDDVTDVLEQM
jgi:hypothetical protein